MKIKLNQDLRTPQGNLKKDSIIEIEDLNEIPLDIFWRNRLRDSAIDNCIEIIKSNIKSK
jgi:hypothetical protein